MTAELRPGAMARPEARMRSEVAIVGSGPGGAVAASQLARAGKSVLVIEEGPFVPAEACDLYSRDEMERKYRNGGVTLALGSPKVTYVEARCVGGGSEVNAGLFYRTPEAVLERWRSEYAIRDLASADLGAHYDALEEGLGVAATAPAPGGAGVPLIDGATQLGFHALDSPSSLRGVSPGAPGRATRASMSRTYLPDAADHGAKLLPDTAVKRLRHGDGRWRLQCRHTPQGGPSRSIEIEADSVYVCCGAVQTPALLRRSGIRRNVGDSLAMHATAKITARFPAGVNYPEMGVPTQAVDEFAPRFTFTCASSSPAYLALEMIQHPAFFQEVDEHWRRMAVYSARVTGGRGSVRTLPGFRDPLVRFQLGEVDLRELSEALRTLARLLFAAGAEVLYPSLLLDAPLRSPTDVARIPLPLDRSRSNLMTIHVSSSCPMGEDRSRCAVDSFGAVHAAPGLYVADGSLLPTSPTVNPQGTIMALVRRNVQAHLGGG